MERAPFARQRSIDVTWTRSLLRHWGCARAIAFVALLSLSRIADGHELMALERSFWINVSLAAPKRGYWGPDFPATVAPSEVEIGNAARVLIAGAHPNRLYLIYHHELPVTEVVRIFRDWRKACPPGVEIIPALVLKMYDKAETPVFATAELEMLLTLFKTEINPSRIAVYDVMPRRVQGLALEAIERRFSGGVIRLGLQPDEPLVPPFAGAVEDTWSAFCHGLTNADWQDRGFGRETLRNWVALRNKQPHAVAWDLIVVAWDYTNGKRGEYPGYDDAHKNMPLPEQRNVLAVREILGSGQPGRIAGFSADLLIVELNSETDPHDGKASSFYATLKAGKIYTGYYARSWQEVCGVFKALSRGETP
jgi:hypothetical protein